MVRRFMRKVRAFKGARASFTSVVGRSTADVLRELRSDRWVRFLRTRALCPGFENTSSVKHHLDRFFAIADAAEEHIFDRSHLHCRYVKTMRRSQEPAHKSEAAIGSSRVV